MNQIFYIRQSGSNIYKKRGNVLPAFQWQYKIILQGYQSYVDCTYHPFKVTLSEVFIYIASYQSPCCIGLWQGYGFLAGDNGRPGISNSKCHILGIQMIFLCWLRIRNPKAITIPIVALIFGCYFIFVPKKLSSYFNLSDIFNIILVILFMIVIYNKHIIYCNKMTPVQQYSKPQFSEPPDEATANYNNILSTIHKQEEQILKILNKYKDTVPDDQSMEVLAKNHRSASIKQQNLNISKIRQRKRTKANASQTSREHKSLVSRTLDSSNIEAQTEKYIKMQPRQKLEMYKLNAYLSNSENKNIKLPSVYMRAKQKKKQQYEIDYEKAEKKYNEGLSQLYQGFSKQEKEKQLSRQKNAKHVNKRKRMNHKILQIYQSQPKQKAGLKNIKKFDNIFDAEQEQQMNEDVPILTQISKPLAYTPYSEANTLQTVKDSKASRYQPQSQLDEDDKPTEVSMTYYIRTLNQKWRQQCQEEVNYLYFSRADESDSNKEWAEQIVKMFEKHDLEIEKMHKSMKYLDSFDEAFFTAAIYQENKK